LAKKDPPVAEPPQAEDRFASSKGQRLAPELDPAAGLELETEIGSNALEENEWSGEYERLRLAHNVYQRRDKEA
jgi:hypothetical protein